MIVGQGRPIEPGATVNECAFGQRELRIVQGDKSSATGLADDANAAKNDVPEMAHCS